MRTIFIFSYVGFFLIGINTFSQDSIEKRTLRPNLGVISTYSPLTEDPTNNGTTIKRYLEKGDTVELIDFKDNFFTVKFNKKVGYVWYYYVQESEVVNNFIDSLQNYRITSQKRIDQELEMKKTIAFQERKKRIISKYGEIAGNRILKHEIWIGMSLEMLKEEKGLPTHVNVSNYGSGNEYQWCWDDYTPSCFYGKSDCIITSYN